MSILKENLKKRVFEKAKQNNNEEVREIDIDKLKENPYQPRMKMNKTNIEELANSIKESGLLQPISVYEYEKDKYYIVAGHRRVEAHKLLGKTTIKAIVSKKENNLKLAQKSLVENMQREDLDILERAIALKNYKENFNKNYDEIAKEIGKSKSTIIKYVSVLELPEEILEDLRKNKSTKDVTALSQINSIAKKEDEVRMRTKNIDELQKSLYFGFLNKGREWLNSEIKQILSKSKEEQKLQIHKKIGKTKAVFTIKTKNKKLTEEMIEKIEEYVQKIINGEL